MPQGMCIQVILIVKMDLNLINKIISRAKQNYFKRTEKYNKFLENKSHFIPLERLIPLDNNNNHDKSKVDDDFDFEGKNSDLDKGERARSLDSNPINVIGDRNSNVPINIVAKNYISPDIFDDEQIESKKDKVKKSHQLAKIPNKLLKKAATEWEPINYRGVDATYDLYKLSKVKIQYDDKEQKLIYNIIEPSLTEEDESILSDLKKAFVYVFEKVIPTNKKGAGSDLIVSGVKKLCLKYNIKLNDEQFEKITYYLERDFLGLDIIEPVMHDPYVEDISCDGLGVPIFINHLKYGPIEINRVFEDSVKLNSFIIKLAQKSNQEVSLSRPILQGALPDGSRVEAIYGKEVSEKGSSFTIRKFRAEPFTPIHLMEFGTMPSFLLAYLWLAVENKQSLLVSGGTATGKTTILNALSLFVPPSAKIVSIEDTPEINLPHEHWLPLIARDGQEKSNVTMFDLLKASLRERPDYIIVGEIRGAEAAILFQGMATGHAGLGTVHAEKFNDLVNRMTIEPINLPKQLLTELDICIFMKQAKVKDNMVRRATSVVEVVDYDPKRDSFTTNEFVHFTPADDSFSFEEQSFVISHLLELRGGKEDALWTEIEKRRRILDFMHKNKILEFKDVSSVIQRYYQDPGNIFEYMEGFVDNSLHDNDEEVV